MLRPSPPHDRCHSVSATGRQLVAARIPPLCGEIAKNSMGPLAKKTKLRLRQITSSRARCPTCDTEEQRRFPPWEFLRIKQSLQRKREQSPRIWARSPRAYTAALQTGQSRSREGSIQLPRETGRARNRGSALPQQTNLGIRRRPYFSSLANTAPRWSWSWYTGGVPSGLENSVIRKRPNPLSKRGWKDTLLHSPRLTETSAPRGSQFDRPAKMFEGRAELPLL